MCSIGGGVCHIVKLAEPFQIKYVDLFAEGISPSSGKTCLPAIVSPLENHDLWAFVQLHEDKYHQVKTISAAAGNHVRCLFRFTAGNLQIPQKLAIGHSMEIMHKDVERLLKAPDFNPVF